MNESFLNRLIGITNCWSVSCQNTKISSIFGDGNNYLTIYFLIISALLLAGIRQAWSAQETRLKARDVSDGETTEARCDKAESEC